MSFFYAKRWLLPRRILTLALAFMIVLSYSPIEALTLQVEAASPKEKGNKKANKVKKTHEMKEKRTANTKTWKNSDLSESIEIFPQAIFYQEEGKKEWKEIDNSITDQVTDSVEKKQFRYQNKANKFKAFFSEDNKNEIFKIKEREHFLSYQIESSNIAKSTVTDNKIVYSNILLNTDVQYTMQGSGVKEDIVFHQQPNFDQIVFNLKTDLDVQEKEDSIIFVDPKSQETIWTFDPLIMFDQNGKSSEQSTYELLKDQGKIRLAVKLDKPFLTDPTTKYPVVLDPTVTAGGSISNTFDTYIQEGGYPSSPHNTEDQLRTGYADSTYKNHRSFIKFGDTLPSISGGLITSAKFKAYKFFEPASVDTTIRIARNLSWSGSKICWVSTSTCPPPPSFTGTYATKTFLKGSANGWYDWDITDLAKYWYKSPSEYHGIAMVDTLEGRSGSYRKFYSSDYNSGSHAPRLEITYSPVPEAPTGNAYSFGAGSGSGYVQLNWNSVPGATGYFLQIYNGKAYENIDVKNTTSWSSQGQKIFPTQAQLDAGVYQFRISQRDGRDLLDDPRKLYTNAYNNPTQPQGTDYRNRTNYAFRVIAYNTNYQSLWSSPLVLTVPDTTAPTKPGTPTAATPVYDNLNLTWTASSDSITGVSKYRVYIGTESGLTDVVNGQEVTTNSFNIKTLQPRTKYYAYVVAVDGQGNVSTISAIGSFTTKKQIDASIQSVSVPSPLELGEDHKVQFTVKNEGLETWTSANNIMLGAVKDPNDPFVKDTTARLTLNTSDAIAPGQTKTFTTTFNGGTAVGLFETKWQMLKVGTGWFGDTFSQSYPVFDTQPPTGNIIINGGRTVTNNQDVTLKLDTKDLSITPVEQKIKNETGVFSDYEPFTSTKSWRLSDGNGDKTVTVVYKDASGNESQEISDSIKLDTNFPSAQLSTPTDYAYINGSVDIMGTATDADLKEYTLSYGTGDFPTDWTVFASGNTQKTNGLLASWDTRSLPAGKYIIRLAVTDQAGNTTIEQRPVWVAPSNSRLGTEGYWGFEAIPLGFGSANANLTNGNLVVDYEDATLDGRQLDPSIGRTYNSQSESPSLLGKGWRLSIESTVTEDASTGDILYTDEDATLHRFVKQADGSYQSPKGLFLKFVKNADGTYTLSDVDPTSVVTTFDAQGRITSITDKNNNQIRYNYLNGRLVEMVDDIGRQITFFYQENGFVSRINLYNGNKIDYIYNTDALLSEVRYIDSFEQTYRTITYQYNGAKQLSKTINPNGHAVSFIYSGDRLTHASYNHTSWEAATGNKLTPVTVNQTLNYDLTNNQVTARTSASTVSDETVYTYNSDGNIIKTVEDPSGLNIQTSSVYVNNLLTESIDGRGNKTTFDYDSIGNLLKKTDATFTDIDGQKITPVTTTEYKLGTRLVTKETDEAGFVTTFDYDSKGNPILAVDSNGFKATSEYDQYGNLTKQTTERGPLYGYVPNLSFEKGDTTTLTGWKKTGTIAFDTTQKQSGTRSVKLTGNASLESDYLEIKKGRLPVRGLGWVKTDAVAGTGVKGTLTYYDANKAKISSVDTSLLTGTNDWKLIHIAADVPSNAAYVTYMISATTTAGYTYVDQVWLEEANLTTQNKYSANGLYLEEAYDKYGNKTSYQYDSYGNVTAQTNSLGQISYIKYDADQKPTESIDRLGKKSINQYDSIGNVIKQINPLNQVTAFQYDEFNNKTVTELPNITKQAYNDDLTPLAPEIVNILEVDQYNEFGQKVATRNPNGRIVTFEYDKAGRIIKEVDPLKNEYHKFYDANSNVIKEESWAYDTATNTLYKKETTLHNIDELNRTVSSTDSSGDPTRIEEKSKYDAADREIKSITGTGVTTDFKYDKEGRIIYTKENSTPALESWTFYDGLGTDAITMDLAGYETKITDANGLLLEVVDAEGKRTKYTYNEVGDKTKQVSADGTETTWEYDAEGQLTRETVKLVQPDSSIKLQITEMEYNDLGQMTQTLYKEQTGTQVVTSKQEIFVYDELGQTIKETILSSGKKTENRYYHDNNGNVTNVWIYDEQDPDGDGNFNSKVVYEYDNDDRLTSSTLTQSGITTRKSYNDKDKEETIQTALGKTTTTYDADDRPTQVINPIFDTYRYTYDVDDGLTRIEGPGVTTNLTYSGDKVSTLKGVNGSGATVVDLSYTYNDLIQVSQITDKGVVKGKYTYTAGGYLETVEANGTKIRYKQDANANFTEAFNETTGKLKATYTYAQGNRITQRKEYNDTTGALLRTTDYTFNADGQVSQAKTVEGSTTTILDYLYTSDSQLQVVNKTVNGVVQSSVSYEYDLEGNRIAKKVGNTRIEYQRDTEGEIFSIATITPTGDGENNITNFNVYRDGNDSLTGFQHNNVPYYYQFNARGDVIAITNAAGTVVSTYEYDEWGNVTKITGDTAVANANPFRYVGKHGVQYDQDTGLYFMGWRDYDPTMGRYLVPDENEGDDENPASKNLYLYAEGDPVNNIDPDGHASSWWGSVWKVTKKVVKTVFADEIKAVKTLTNKNTSLWSKVKAAGSLVTSFTPGLGQIKKAYKAAKLLKKYGPKVYRYAKKAYRAGKKVQRKARKFIAPGVKKVRQYKAKARAVVQQVKTKRKTQLDFFKRETRLNSKGERIMSTRDRRKFKKSLKGTGVKVKFLNDRDYAKKVRKGMGKQGEFASQEEVMRKVGAFESQTATIYLRKKESSLSAAYHESYHAKQWNLLGKGKYDLQSTFEKEDYVMKQFIKNKSMFNDAELRAQSRYMHSVINNGNYPDDPNWDWKAFMKNYGK